MRALNMATETRVALEDHIRSCEQSSGDLKKTVDDRMGALSSDIHELKAFMSRVGWNIATLMVATIGALMGVIGTLLHSKGLF
jgi:hypothetical protein